MSSAVQLLAALVMTGTFTSTPDQAYLDMAENQYVVPALGTSYGKYVPVTTPEQAWPITGIFDYTFGRSVQIGVQDLEDEMANYPNQPLLIFGYSQSSVIADLEKRKLTEFAKQNPDAPVPDITFVCIGCLNLPNGGVMARYPGAYIPIINFYFNGPSPTDTPFPSVFITNGYDGFADSPMYPALPLSTVNGLLGMVYAHTEYDELSLTDPAKYRKDTYGNNTYYYIYNDNLPLFGPARSLGVPEEFIDIVEPFFTVIVEWGYDRSIPPWEPTPARLIPVINPITAAGDLLTAIEEGIDNALAILGTPPPLTIPAPETTAAARTQLTEAAAPVAESTPEPAGAPPATGTEEATEKSTTTTATEPSAESKDTETSTGEESSEASPKSTHSPRPKLRGPIGSNGPRFRDFVRRAHSEPSTSNSTDADPDGDASSAAAGGSSPAGSRSGDSSTSSPSAGAAD